VLLFIQESATNGSIYLTPLEYSFFAAFFVGIIGAFGWLIRFAITRSINGYEKSNIKLENSIDKLTGVMEMVRSEFNGFKIDVIKQFVTKQDHRDSIEGVKDLLENISVCTHEECPYNRKGK
jgi:hypothetical protein